MGVDLTLMPFDGELSDECAFSRTLLNLHRRRELWVAIEELPRGGVVPQVFDTYLGRNAEGDTCYGNTQQTPYGDPLTWIRAGTLLHVRFHQGVQDNSRNRAAWAYLAELPPDTRVALYWC